MGHYIVYNFNFYHSACNSSPESNAFMDCFHSYTTVVALIFFFFFWKVPLFFFSCRPCLTEWSKLSTGTFYYLNIVFQSSLIQSVFKIMCRIVIAWFEKKIQNKIQRAASSLPNFDAHMYHASRQSRLLATVRVLALCCFRTSAI